MLFFQLCERAVRSRVTLRKEGQVELFGETPKRLSAARYCETCRNAVNAIFRREDASLFALYIATTSDLQDQAYRELVYRPLQFHERSSHFIGPHDETLSIIAVRVHNPDGSP